jgi:GT2 family glycosyltransferase
MIDELITGIVVNYCTPEIKTAVNSIKKFYPKLKIIVIDGSPQMSEGYTACDELRSINTKIIHVEKNIGHGHGLNHGITFAKTDYILIFDSDIEMIRLCLNDMLHELSVKKCYGIGEIQITDENGFNKPQGIKYLHPYFALISREKYKEFSKFLHHGAPLIKTMNEINAVNQGLLLNFPVKNYVRHDYKGTRKLNPVEFLQNWESAK